MEENNLIESLVGAFMYLPGVGYKTAQRYVYQILNGDEEQEICSSDIWQRLFRVGGVGQEW